MCGDGAGARRRSVMPGVTRNHFKRGSLRTSPLQCQNWSFAGLPKMELEGRSKNETQKCEEDEIKGIQKWSRKFRDILMLVPNTFPHPFSAKDVVVKLTGKVENALGSKGKNAAVHQKETEHNKKGGSARAIMSRGRCIDHPQKWKVLYLSID